MTEGRKPSRSWTGFHTRKLIRKSRDYDREVKEAALALRARGGSGKITAKAVFREMGGGAEYKIRRTLDAMIEREEIIDETGPWKDGDTGE
jgi:hypothetical protein